MDSIFLVYIGVLAILGIISLATFILKHQSNSGFDPLVLNKFASCINGWMILFVFVATFFYVPGGKYFVTLLFGVMSFWAMREFITLIPTRKADHRTLFFLFFLCIPAQYFLVGGDFYEIYSVLIPSFIFLLIPMLIAMFGDTKFYLTRITQICVSLLICVYSLSFVPALLTADMEPAVSQTATQTRTENSQNSDTPQDPESQDQVCMQCPAEMMQVTGETALPKESETAKIEETAEEAETVKAEENISETAAVPQSRKSVNKMGLLLFFFLTTQLSEIFPFLAGMFCKNQHPIAPAINVSKTWEGLIFSLVGTFFAGNFLLYFIIPFNIWSCGLAASLIALMGFGGTLTLSAIKRDRGVRDYGTLVAGHHGILDRIDSICFAAPVFFHIVQIYLRYPNIFLG